MKRFAVFSIVLSLVSLWTNTLEAGDGADFIAREDIKVIRVAPMDPVTMTEITGEDWLYIKGKYKNSVVKVKSNEVKFIIRVLDATEDAKANLPKSADNLVSDSVQVPLIKLANYWGRVEKRALEERFNKSTKRILYTFKADDTINSTWPWAREHATYYLAEQFYFEGDFQKAIDTFNELLEGYPRSRFALRACLKIGQAYMELNDFDKARNFFEEAKNDVLGRYKEDIRNVRDAGDAADFSAKAREWELLFDVYKARTAKFKAQETQNDGDIHQAVRENENIAYLIKNAPGMQEAKTQVILDKLDLMLLQKHYEEAVQLCEKNIRDWVSSGDRGLAARMPYIYTALADTRRIRAMENNASLQGMIDMNFARWYYLYVVIGFPENPKLLGKALYYAGWTGKKMEEWGAEEDGTWKIYWQRLKNEFPESRYAKKAEEN